MRRYYCGYLDDGSLQAFTSTRKPTFASHGKRYLAVLGPFRTKRATLWAEKHARGNPHARTVDDIETLARQDRKG